VKSRLLALLLVLALMPAAQTVALAQTNDPAQSAAANDAQDWQDLNDLKPGKQILVVFKPNIGDAVEAKFVSAIGTKLTIKSHGYTRSLEQRDIQSVYRLKGSLSRRAAGRIGMVVGLLVGAYLDTTVITPPGRPVTATDDGTPGFAGAIFGALIGNGVGRLLGGKRKGKLLYDAK
jgi:hypothetical protein